MPRFSPSRYKYCTHGSLESRKTQQQVEKFHHIVVSCSFRLIKGDRRHLVFQEANLISQVTRNILLLFANDKNDEEWAVESCQIIANQVRILMSRTRGLELLSIMKADTYASLLAIVDDYHFLHGCDEDFSAQEESIIGQLRNEIGQLMESRALRLSDEASSLPPTHFLLLTSLSVTSTIAYVVASLKVVDDLW